jgi:hypothetical protein
MMLTALIMTFMPSLLHASAPEPVFYEESTLTLNVNDLSGAAEDLIKKAESVGGYFTHYTDYTIRFSVPFSKTKEFLAYAETVGTLADKQYQTTNYGEELDRKRNSLRAKENILDKYLDVLKTAKTQKITSVEREIIQLVTDIETLKGSIQFIEHLLAYSKVSIQFRFKDRNAPVTAAVSSFPWLNTVNLQTMIQDFQNEKK